MRQPIRRVKVLSRAVLSGMSGEQLQDRVSGRRFDLTRRHGKHLFLHPDSDGWIMPHFGMTGRLACSRDGNEPPGYTRLLPHLAAGHVACTSRRKHGDRRRVIWELRR